MSTLLETFASVTVDETLLISTADVAFCESQQRKYDAQVDHLRYCESALQATKLQMSAEGKLKPAEVLHAGYTFDIEKSINQIRSRLIDLKGYLVNSICSYFGSTYNFSITSLPNIESCGDWRDIVRSLMESVGGDFIQLGFSQIRKNLQCYFRYKEVEKCGAKIVFHQGLSIINKYGYNGPRIIEAYDRKTQALCEAISYFKSRSLKADPEILNVFPTDRYSDDGVLTKFPCVLHLPGYESLISLTGYKNGKTIITFTSSTEADRFHEMFVLP